MASMPRWCGHERAHRGGVGAAAVERKTGGRRAGATVELVAERNHGDA
jgi:hypothetical protein